MGSEIRAGLRTATPSPASVAPRRLASGRGGGFDRGPKTLALACRYQDGYVLDEIVQSRRDTKAAKRLLIRLLKKAGMPPKRIRTDKRRSYGAAKRDATHNAGFPIRWQSAAVRLDLLGAPKSLRQATSQTIRPCYSHSPHLRNNALASRDGRGCLISESSGRSSITAR